MPEGPTVRKFESLVCLFVGQLVMRAGGSTKQIKLQDLMGQRFLNSQVHGKNLYLAFGDTRNPRTQVDSDQVEETDNRSHRAGSSQEKLCMVGEETSGEPSQSPSEQTTEELAKDEQAPKWLRFHFGLYGSIRANEFARARRGNKRGDWRDPSPRLTLHFDSGRFLVFYNCRMSWCSSPVSDPATDILCPEFDKERALQALLRPTPVCITLMDQRYFSGVGNIIKNEILFLARVHPLSFGSLLPLERLRSILDHAVTFTSDWLRSKLEGKGLHYHIYLRERCDEGHKVVKEAIGPEYGLKRLTWYCPKCQPHVKPEDVD
ncbi:endonuclease 8-like 2 [Pelodytes ibericus]